MSFQLSLSSIPRTSSGIISSGTDTPISESNPTALVTPSSFFISRSIARVSLRGRSESTSSMETEFMP